MSLKIKREQLERIVHEELLRFISEQVNEARPGRGTVLDDEPPSPEDAPEEQLPGEGPAGDVTDVDAGGAAGGPGESPELPTGDEPSDDDLDADVAGDEESGAEPGSVAAELEGKTIESITLDEDSKVMPGAQEIVVTFQQNPDALRLLLTKTGKIKIFYKGLHNDFGSPVEQVPGEEEPEELGGEEMPGEEVPVDALGGEETEEMPPLGAEDMPPEEEPLEEPPKSKKSQEA